MFNLPNVDVLKQQHRVKSFLNTVDDPLSDSYAILRETLISDAELDVLRAQYPRERRRQLERKWSFNEVGSALANNNVGIKNFDALRYLLSYTYGMGSHLVHQDFSGIQLIHNRLKKDSKDAVSDELAHASRQINDLVIMSSFRAAMVYHLHNRDARPVMDLFNQHQQFLEDMARERRDWWTKYFNSS